MRNYWFPIRKGGIFRPGKEIKGLRGGVHRYAAQVSPKIDAARAEKNPFRTETTYDPDEGDVGNGVSPGTPFEELPAGWECPRCGVGKDLFEEIRQGCIAAFIGANLICEPD